jgi:uncharacterized membrane protein
MKRCTRCGTEVDDNEKFCTRCGSAKLEYITLNNWHKEIKSTNMHKENNVVSTNVHTENINEMVHNKATDKAGKISLINIIKWIARFIIMSIPILNVVIALVAFRKVNEDIRDFYVAYMIYYIIICVCSILVSVFII